MSDTRSVGLNLRMKPEQLATLRADAAAMGISVQAYLEFKLFGQIAPRQINRRDAVLPDDRQQGLFKPVEVEGTASAA